MPYLDFQAERDSNSDSWTRSNPDGALIEHVDTNTYRVLLPGGNVHDCNFATERGGYVGYCDCKGWQFRDDDSSPCAHLCTLRKAEFADKKADDGHPITAKSSISEIDPEAVEPEPEVLADGGADDYAAGEDSEVFGRPEAQL